MPCPPCFVFLFSNASITSLSVASLAILLQREEYSCILDKGTFDALAPPPPSAPLPKTKAAAASVNTGIQSRQMLREICRVLKPAGRFICISLLQAHVAEMLIGYFHDLGWIIQITRCVAAEKRCGPSQIVFPVYVCSFMKPLQPREYPYHEKGVSCNTHTYFTCIGPRKENMCMILLFLQF